MVLTDEEVAKRALTIQPKLAEYLQAELKDLEYGDQRKVLRLLMEIGVDAYRTARPRLAT